MKTLLQSRRISTLAVLLLVTPLVLLTARPALAQSAPGGQAMAAYFSLIMLAVFIPFYIYWALATQVIASKTATENGWMAWVPVANLILWANIAKRPVWWGLLCIIPLVGLVFMVLLWIGMAEARKKPGWWGIMLVVPFVGLVVPGYLAWSE